jgi:hypothetical protein
VNCLCFRPLNDQTALLLVVVGGVIKTKKWRRDEEEKEGEGNTRFLTGIILMTKGTGERKFTAWRRQ